MQALVGVLEMRVKYSMKRENGENRQIHTLIAETTIGRKLPIGAEVHHFDGNGRNNSRGNLVICPSRSYHMMLHMRQDAMDSCGNPDWRKCRFCKQYDDQKNLVARKAYGKKKVSPMQHQRCENAYMKNRRAA